MNILRQEIWQYRRGLIGWCLGLIIFLSIYMPFMPVFQDQATSLKAFFENLGPAATELLGMDINLLFGPIGFYSYVFIFVTLLGAIQACSLGLNIMSKETRLKTADFLLTKTKSRTSVFFQKMCAAIICLLITEIVYYLGVAVAMFAVAQGDVQYDSLVLINVSLTFVQLLFLSIGMVIALVVPKIKSTTPVAVGISLGFFIIGMISNFTQSDVLRWFAPMRYFDSNYIMAHTSYEWNYFVLCIVATLVFWIASYVIYIRRDIDAV